MSKHNLTDLEFQRDSLVSQLRALNTAIESAKEEADDIKEAAKTYIKDISYKSISSCPFSKSLTRGLEREFNDTCEFVRSYLFSIHTSFDGKIVLSVRPRGRCLSAIDFAMLEAYMTLLRSNLGANFLISFS